MRNITKENKVNQVDINIFKVKKKSARTRCEICPKLTIKVPNRRYFCRSVAFIVNFVLLSFLLTLNRWMPLGACCIHFQIYRSCHPEVFFKKRILRIFSQFTGELHAKVSHGYSSVNMLHTCSKTPFLVKTSRELLLYIAPNSEIINIEALSNNCLEYILIL